MSSHSDTITCPNCGQDWLVIYTDSKPIVYTTGECPMCGFFYMLRVGYETDREQLNNLRADHDLDPLEVLPEQDYELASDDWRAEQEQEAYYVLANRQGGYHLHNAQGEEFTINQLENITRELLDEACAESGLSPDQIIIIKYTRRVAIRADELLAEIS